MDMPTTNTARDRCARGEIWTAVLGRACQPRQQAGLVTRAPHMPWRARPAHTGNLANRGHRTRDRSPRGRYLTGCPRQRVPAAIVDLVSRSCSSPGRRRPTWAYGQDQDQGRSAPCGRSPAYTEGHHMSGALRPRAPECSVAYQWSQLPPRTLDFSAACGRSRDPPPHPPTAPPRIDGEMSRFRTPNGAPADRSSRDPPPHPRLRRRRSTITSLALDPGGSAAAQGSGPTSAFVSPTVRRETKVTNSTRTATTAGSQDQSHETRTAVRERDWHRPRYRETRLTSSPPSPRPRDPGMGVLPSGMDASPARASSMGEACSRNPTRHSFPTRRGPTP